MEALWVAGPLRGDVDPTFHGDSFWGNVQKIYGNLFNLGMTSITISYERPCNICSIRSNDSLK